MPGRSAGDRAGVDNRSVADGHTRVDDRAGKDDAVVTDPAAGADMTARIDDGARAHLRPVLDQRPGPDGGVWRDGLHAVWCIVEYNLLR